MRVLVTGASGFVGAHLDPLLRDAGHHVTTLSRDGEVDFRVDVTDGDAVARAVLAVAPGGDHPSRGDRVRTGSRARRRRALAR